MCTADDTDIDGEALMPKEENHVSNQCVRCKKEACLVLRRKDVYCKECFLFSIDHKCRSSLGKSKQMKPDDKVLVGFSGSPSSIVLLHVLWMGKRPMDHKKLMYQLIFCYIDDGAIFEEDRREMVLKLRETVESYGFEFHDVSLDKSLYFGENVKTQTSKEDLLSKLKQKLLIETARQLKCNKIFTAENQNNIGIKLLSKIALGVGDQLPQEVGFSDSRNANIQILRPMCDIDSKSIFHYIKFKNLPEIEKPIRKTAPSIQKLTADFVNGLQEEFPSTVATIYRTGAKLSEVINETSDSDICLLCETTRIEKFESPYTAEDAMAFTRSVSQPLKKCNECSCSKPNQKIMKSSFCYSCLNIINDMESIDQLPANVLAKLNERKSMNTMLKEIEDFLL